VSKKELKAVYEMLGEFFDSPCNWGVNTIDETVEIYMLTSRLWFK